jgi:hypothetical protein
MYISYWSSHSINRVFSSLLPHHRNDDGNGTLEDEDLNVRSNQASSLSLYSRLIGESLSFVPLLCWVVFVVFILASWCWISFFPGSRTFYVDTTGRNSSFFKYSSRRLYTDVCTFRTGPLIPSIVFFCPSSHITGTTTATASSKTKTLTFDQIKPPSSLYILG